MAEAENYQHYKVLRREDGSLWELGKGAMGITYKAFDTNLRCTVALKVINNTYLNSEVARQRFLREARAAAALRHQNVASVFHLGSDHDCYFYAMEFIDGQTVASYIENEKKGPLDPIEALNICLQVTRALAAAARQHLVHRDLKPANLMLVDQDGERIVKVIDFGLAKSAKTEGEDSGTLTQAGGFVGTPHFASPEQLEERDIDIRSDIYSLGVTLYYMLTGRPPFSGSVPQIMSQHLYKPVPLEPLQNQPQCVVDVVLKMMDKDRDKRQQTPGDLRQEIVACLEQLELGSPPAPAAKNGSPVGTEQPDTEATGDVTFPGTVQALAAQTIVGERYQLVREIQEVPQGRKFYAHDLRHARGVSLLIFSELFLADKAKFTWVEQEVGKLQEAPHESIREVFSLESTDQNSYLVEEFVVGPTLLAILRARGELTPHELGPLLNQLAALADHATAHNLNSVDLSLNGVQLIYPGLIQASITPGLLQQPLTTWPPFNVKVTPLDFSVSAADSGATWTGAATVVETVQTGGVRSSYIRLLSLLAYELVGGPRATVESTGRVSPVPGLSESGNAILRRGIADDFGSSVEFADALLRVVRGEEPLGVPASFGPAITQQNQPSMPANRPTPEVVPLVAPQTSSGYSTKPPSPQGPPISTRVSNADPNSTGGAILAPPPLPLQPPTAPPRKKSRISTIGLVLILVLVGFILLLLGSGGYFVWQTINSFQPPNIAQVTPKPTPNPVVTPSPVVTPRSITPTPAPITPRPSTPSPTPTPVLSATPTPIPTPVVSPSVPPATDALATALKSADDLERAGDWAGALKQLNNILTQYPSGAVETRKRLENLLSQVRSSKTNVTPDNFSIVKPDIETAARVGVVQAMLLLADNTATTDTAYALDWFEQAAAKGNVTAKREAGLLLARHHNPTDDAKAFQYLKEAADAGDAYAKYCVAECYYYGKLVPTDENKALTYLQEAAALRSPPAIDLLGSYYRKIHNYESAIAYYQQAIAMQYARSMANLGVMYLLGEGVTKDVPRAVNLFKLAADHNDEVGLYLYGTALTEGINGVKNRNAGTGYIRKAAEMGHPLAIEWCRKNKIPYGANQGTDDPAKQ
jgi:serine/threonine protein kinase